MERTIILIRHGRSLHNANGNAFSGVTDVQMDETGQAQCRNLAGFFNGVSIDRLYCSSLGRAQESARLIFPGRADRLAVLDWLIEFNYGEYEGKIADAMPDDPVVRQWNTTPGDTVFPGGDAIRHHADRVHSALLTFCRELPPKCRVACVTHRTTIRLLVARIMGLDLNRFRDVPCSNCSITDIRVNESGTRRIYALNITPEYTGRPPYGEE